MDATSRLEQRIEFTGRPLQILLVHGALLHSAANLHHQRLVCRL